MFFLISWGKQIYFRYFFEDIHATCFSLLVIKFHNKSYLRKVGFILAHCSKELSTEARKAWPQELEGTAHSVSKSGSKKRGILIFRSPSNLCSVVDPSL